MLCEYEGFLDCEELSCASQRVQVHGNNEAGCERENSSLNKYKNKYSAKMTIRNMQARSRVKSNCPPVHMFNPAPILRHWLDSKHRTAFAPRIQDEISAVIRRIRKNSSEKLKYRLFLLN